jgi:flagellar hook assembly protein FlgD
MGAYGGPNRPDLIPGKAKSGNRKPFITGFSNFPNPVRGHTTFTFNVESDEHVTLKIYDFNGTHIKTLLNGRQSNGNHSVEWNVYDHGNMIPDGSYVAVLSAGGAEERRIVQIKR